MTTPTSSLDAMAGITLADKYRLVSLIGAGGMGYVYLAEQIGLGRTVAIKILRPELLSSGVDWFQTEAMAASRINHPHAVSIYDFGRTNDGVPFLVMEHLRGRTLADMIDQGGPLEIGRVVEIGAQVLSALTEAHSCGVVHCDLSSDNVIIDNFANGGDFAKVIDFGLARLFERRRGDDALVGTPEYMAPEQLRGEPIGPAADLYAVGVLLYEMIVGRTPFAGSSTEVILDGHLHASPQAPHEVMPGCPPHLGTLVLWALTKNPDNRPRDAGAMRDTLLRVFGDDRFAPACPQCGYRSSWHARYCTGCGGLMTAEPKTARAPELARGSAPVKSARRTSRISAEVERSSARIPLLGRERELEQTIAFCRGDSLDRSLALLGPAGVGKARLVLEASRSLGRQVAFFIAGPDPSGTRSPWYPVLSILERVLDLAGQPTIDQLTRAVAQLGLPDRDVPGLAEIFGLDGPARQLELAVRRREARASALRALLSIQRRYPRAVLAFIDLHEFDQPTRGIVASLVERAEETGVRLLLTAERIADVPPEVARLELEGLSPDETRELARQLLPEGAELPGADELHALTHGSPTAVEQLVGWLQLGHGTARAPTLLVDLISTRINSMSAQSRRLIQAAAIHGCALPRWLLEATLDDPEAVRAAGRGFTGLIDIGPSEVTITSAVVRDVILASTPAHVARTLHLRALEALDGRASAAVLGYHAERADDHERAYRELMVAGRDAVERFDDVGAANLYQRAFAQARASDRLGDPDAPRRAVEAALALADVLRFTGRVALALGALDEALVLQPTEEQRVRIRAARGRVLMSSNDLDSSIETLRGAVGHAVRIGDRDLIAASYVDLARALSRADRRDEARDELAQALDVLSLGQGLPVSNGPDSLWYVGMLLAESQLAAGSIDDARATATSALEQARQTGSPRGRARLSALLAEIHARAGDLSPAFRHRATAIDEMRTLGDRRSTAQLLIDNAALPQGKRAPTPPPTPGGDWASNPRRGLRIASRLAREVDWTEGIMLSRRARDDDTEI